MKEAYFVKTGETAVREADKPVLQADNDVIIKVLRACVCGSDLWNYRDLPQDGMVNSGHEAIGIVEEAGKAHH